MLSHLLNAPRYARVAQLGFKAGNQARIAEGLAKNAGNSPAIARLASRYSRHSNDAYNASQNLVRKADLDSEIAKTVGKTADTVGHFTQPVYDVAANSIGGMGAVTNAVLSNPVGQVALFTAPSFLMAGGEQMPPEYSQLPPSMPPEFSQVSPSIMPSDIPEGMMMQPGGPQPLDDEQVSRARKRAEEQAALQMFYAQALQQYGGMPQQ